MIDEMNEHVARKVHNQANGTHDTAPQPFGFSKRVRLDLKHYRRNRQLLRDLSRVTLLNVITESFARIEELEQAAKAPALEWHPYHATVGNDFRLPDAETTVLLAFDDGDVTAGYWGEGGWFYTDGGEVCAKCTHWAHFPESPVHHS
jgi:hypothetical protein